MSSHEMHLVIPANTDDVLMMRMAVSAFGLLCGLDADLIGDLRIVTNECCECLMGRARLPEKLELQTALRDGRMQLSFRAVGAQASEGQPIDRDMAYGILSTLMPEVQLREDESGIVQIDCSMPASGDGAHE